MSRKPVAVLVAPSQSSLPRSHPSPHRRLRRGSASRPSATSPAKDQPKNNRQVASTTTSPPRSHEVTTTASSRWVTSSTRPGNTRTSWTTTTATSARSCRSRSRCRATMTTARPAPPATTATSDASDRNPMATTPTTSAAGTSWRSTPRSVPRRRDAAPATRSTSGCRTIWHRATPCARSRIGIIRGGTGFTTRTPAGPRTMNGSVRSRSGTSCPPRTPTSCSVVTITTTRGGCRWMRTATRTRAGSVSSS